MSTEIVSFSEVYKKQTCNRAYYYRHILGLRKIEESDALATGNRGHKLLQNFYLLLGDGYSKEEAHKLVTVQAGKELANRTNTDFSLLKAWTLVDNYIRETEFKAQAIHVESRFLVPVNKLTDAPDLDNVLIGFTPDLVLERKGNFVDIEDYKFIQRAWSQKKINRFSQLKLYQLFMEAMGYTISRTTIRFFNVQTGKIIPKHFEMTPAEKGILIDDFLAGVRETLELKKRLLCDDIPNRTMNYTACQFCDFEGPCTLQAQGKSATKTLATEYAKSEYDYSS